MKKKLIATGFFSELKHGRPDGGSLRASLQPKPGAEDARLVAYLRAGKRLMVAPGPVRDVLAANAIIGTLEIFTDVAERSRSLHRTPSRTSTHCAARTRADERVRDASGGRVECGALAATAGARRSTSPAS
ncbi:MAG TPA: hypothetical protein VGG74_35585 [Kofleriaceae bacterium]